MQKFILRNKIMNVGKVKFIRPKNPHLLQYIKGYYVHTADDIDFHTQISFYQNITTTISIYQDTTLSFDGEKCIQTHTPNNGFSAFLVVKVNRHQEVEFRGLLNRISIVFYPLGINHFIKQPLSKLTTTGRYAPFHYFNRVFETLLPLLYSTSDLTKKRDLLDDFLMQQFHDFQEKRLIKAVHQIIYNDATIKVSELSNQLNINRRTLLRLFQKHLIYSIEEYIAVVKFRKALLEFQQQDKPKLTDIAMQSDYYDQADFNHQFKYRTDMTPSELFSRLEIMDDVLFWTV